MRPITDVIQDILKHLKRFLPTFSDIIMYAPLHQLVSVSVGPAWGVVEVIFPLASFPIVKEQSLVLRHALKTKAPLRVQFFADILGGGRCPRMTK